jgi:hypothetical protein
MGGEGHTAREENVKNVHKILVGKPERKTCYGYKWVDNIKTDITEIRCGAVE